MIDLNLIDRNYIEFKTCIHLYFQAIGNRLHEILAEENTDRFTVIHQVSDESKKRELKTDDEEEDFLDEGL